MIPIDRGASPDPAPRASGADQEASGARVAVAVTGAFAAITMAGSAFVVALVVFAGVVAWSVSNDGVAEIESVTPSMLEP